MKYIIWLAGKDKVKFILEELKDNAVVVGENDNMTAVEININNATVLVQLFYAGYFCAMDQVKTIR